MMSPSNKLLINLINILNIILIANAYHLAKRFKNDSFCNPIKVGKLNVHIISHTHLDTGWVKTYDAYYKDSVVNIMRTVIESLGQGLESRRFTFVEMSYFSRYWNSVDDKEREVIRQLILKGKLQITSGGWVMNDEATPHYSMIIDQMSYGHRWITKTFGSKFIPNTGWQIDPFGHSVEFASILSQMGFNALFLGRIDFQDKDKRMAEKSMEFIWKTDHNLKQNNYIFTGITPSGYYPSEGVCLNCHFETNGPALLKQVKNQTHGYRTNHLMSTMGGDFNYVSAEWSFNNLDQLINYVNGIQNDTHLLYSTPDCYVKAVYEAHHKWTDTKTDDFLPYADMPNDFWSGYFTSRPSIKYLINYANSVLQVSKQLMAISDIDSKNSQLLRPLEESVGICQHHDAISGTSKQFVVDDYIHMLSTGLTASEQLIAIAYQNLMNTNIKPQFCHSFNISECLYLDRANGFPTQIAIYNPLAHLVSHYVRLPLIEPNFQIVDSNGAVIQSQIVSIPQFIQTLAERQSGAKYEILFEAKLSPLTFTHYSLLNVLTPRQSSEITPESSPSPKADVVIGNDKLKVMFEGTTGLLKSIQSNGYSIPMRQNFGYYTRGSGKNSGTYAMHTNGTDPNGIAKNASLSVVKGNLTEEVIQEFTPWLKQIVRVHRNSDYVEFDWTVGPIPDNMDFEIISRYDTGFRTNKTFYTDSNGKQTLERRRNYRPTWKLETKELVSSNYYPISSWIFIRDVLTDLQLTILPDRTQGGSSLLDGSVELMLHRRLHKDDGYGVEEALNEPGVDGKGLVVRGKHLLLFDKIEESMKKVKLLSKKLFWKPLPLFLPINQNNEALDRQMSANGIRINEDVNPFIHLLTLEELEENVLFIRLEYILEKNETKEESVSVDLNKLFTGIEILETVESDLTGTESLVDMMARKYDWDCDDCPHSHLDSQLNSVKPMVTLSWNQIRSFVLKVKTIHSNVSIKSRL